MSSIVSGRCNCSRQVVSSTLSSTPSDCRSAKKYEIGTARIFAIAARREALTRLAPCSYFCTCWQQGQAECAAKAATTVGGTGCGGGHEPPPPGRGGEQNLGVHPLAQPAEPGEPPRDPGGRQAHESLRHGQGDHVRDEQEPHP